MSTRWGISIVGAWAAIALVATGVASADKNNAAKQVATKVPAKTAVAKKQPAKAAPKRTLIGSVDLDLGLVTEEPEAPQAQLAVDVPAGVEAAGLETLTTHAAEAEKLDLGRTRASAVPSDEVMLRLQVQSLSADDITRVVRRNLERVQFCYEKIAARAEAPSGAVQLHFTVEPKGHVSGISVAAPGVNGKQLEGCMVSSIKKWKFPAADAPTIVDYPLVFDVAGTTITE